MAKFQEYLNEKIQKTDITKLASKADDFQDVSEILGNDPVKFLKTLLNKEKLNTIISEYLKMKGVNNTDSDLLFLSTALATIINKVKTVDSKISKDFPKKKK